MATIEKTSPTNWRITKMYKGKRYRLNVDRKPTKAEAERMIWALIEQAPVKNEYMSFGDAATKYLQDNELTFSPSTKRLYQNLLDHLPESITKRPLSALTDEMLQADINVYSINHKPNTVHNRLSFIKSVIRSVRGKNYVINVTNPLKRKTDFYVPEDSDIKKILDYEKDGKYELLIWLGIFGLRRSEACALLKTDLSDDNILTIDKAKVQGPDGKFYIKSTKTADSTRNIQVSDYVAELIRNLPQNEVFTGSPITLSNRLIRVEKRLNIEHFSYHKLRHYFASTAREIMGDSYVEKMGGWSQGSDIMKKVYDYAKKKQEKESQQAYGDKLEKLLG